MCVCVREREREREMANSSKFTAFSSGPDVHWSCYFIQNCVILLVYFLVNSETASWVSWNTPYQTLFFQTHLLAMVLDVMKKAQYDVNTKQLCLHAPQASLDFGVSFALLVTDSTLLIRQAIDVKNSSTTSTNAGIIQLSLVAFVSLFSIFRFLAACRRSIQSKKTKKDGGSTYMQM